MNELSARKRPILVQIISIFFIFFNALLLFFSCILLSGLVPYQAELPPETVAFINDQLTVFNITHSFINIAAGIALFRLQKVALYLFAILLGISLFNSQADWLLGLILEWGTLIAICIYAWRLKQKGVLR